MFLVFSLAGTESCSIFPSQHCVEFSIAKWQSHNKTTPSLSTCWAKGGHGRVGLLRRGYTDLRLCEPSQCSPVQSESAALSKWMYGMKAEEEGLHLPLLMNSTKSTQLKASPSPFSSSFSLHSVCVKRGLFIIIQGQSWLKVIKPCPSITLAFQPVTGPSIKGDTSACVCVRE